jgi:hypothetical protein
MSVIGQKTKTQRLIKLCSQDESPVVHKLNEMNRTLTKHPEFIMERGSKPECARGHWMTCGMTFQRITVTPLHDGYDLGHASCNWYELWRMCGTIILIPFISPSLHNESMMVDAVADVTPVREICLDQKHLTTSIITISNLLETYSYFWHMFDFDILSLPQGPIDHWRDFDSHVFRTRSTMLWCTDLTHPNWRKWWRQQRWYR